MFQFPIATLIRWEWQESPIGRYIWVWVKLGTYFIIGWLNTKLDIHICGAQGPRSSILTHIHIDSHWDQTSTPSSMSCAPSRRRVGRHPGTALPCGPAGRLKNLLGEARDASWCWISSKLFWYIIQVLSSSPVLHMYIIYPRPSFGAEKRVPLYFCSFHFFLLVCWGQKKCSRFFCAKEGLV